MKLELGMQSREIQHDWYGKCGISLHVFLLYCTSLWMNGELKFWMYGLKTPRKLLGLPKVHLILDFCGWRKCFPTFKCTYFQVSTSLSRHVNLTSCSSVIVVVMGATLL